MIPRTFPTTVEAETGNREMVVFYLSSITGLSRWVDYIPVRTVQNEVSEENNTNANGFQAVNALTSVSGLVSFRDYIPVYEDTSATVPFSTNADGYIPVGISGGGSATLFLNFAYSKALDSRITFTRADSTTCATYFDSTGVLRTAAANIPRFDHDPATLVCKGLLIEEARTNLVLQSTWTGGTSGTLGSGAVAPTSWSFIVGTGTVTYTATDIGNSIRFVAATQRPMIGQNFAATSGNSYIVSCRVVQNSGSSPINTLVAIVNGTATFTAASYLINNVSALSSAVPIAGDVISALCSCTGTGNGQARIGAGAAVGNVTADVTLTYPQVEVGAFFTSYIPTTTTTVTRAADVASMTGTNFSSWFNATEGTFAAVCDQYSPTGTRPIFRCDDTTANELFSVRGNVADPEFLIVDGGVTQAQIDVGTISANTQYKIAAAYNLNDIAACKDGGTVGTDSSATMPTVTQVRLGSDGTNYLSGHISRIVYYPKRLSNATLQTLTR